jgi:general secretion pathway protein A
MAAKDCPILNMYTSFFGLNEKPFSITPDPRYLFMSERHTEALAHLVYGLNESGGFIQLTGEVGTGKTTLVRGLLQQLPEETDVALILNPQISRTEFLIAICEELGALIPEDTCSSKALTDSLNHFLLKNHGRGRRTVLIVDEAQNLAIDVLEQVRLLTNLETSKQKLLQIILIGQPELRELLARNELRQLAQRVTGRYHLEPLLRDETSGYIDHRLNVAGAPRQIFSPQAKREVYRLSQGVPRIINVICDRSLLGAFSTDEPEISPELVRRAAAEVYDASRLSMSRWFPGLKLVIATAAVAVVVAGVAWAAVSMFDSGSEPGPSDSEPVPVREMLGNVLTDQSIATDTASAFDVMFKLWSSEYVQGSGRACEQAERRELFCLFQRGTLSQVRSLDRPAILSLRDGGGNLHQVVLSGLTDTTALITVGDRNIPVTIDDLQQYWFGEYLLLWRPQIGEVKAFFPGMRDSHVKWLRESLSAIQGQPVAPMTSDYYDAYLEERVKDYQREKRLNVDGLVGHQTQIAINTDLGAETPRLAQVN